MRGTHGERGTPAYNRGLWTEPPAGSGDGAPAGSRGRASGQTVRGKALFKLKCLQHWDVQQKRHFWGRGKVRNAENLRRVFYGMVMRNTKLNR